MNNYNFNSNTSVLFENSEIPWPRPLRFWLLLIFEVPAVATTLFTLLFLLLNRTTRIALHNHTIIVLLSLALINQLVDVPWHLDFLRKGIVSPATPAHCLVWWFVNLGIYNTTSLVLAWMSIERHIFVFHNRWVRNHRKRFMIHSLPLILLLIYAMAYYTWVIFFPPCQHTFIYTLVICSATPCYLHHAVIGIWDTGIHGGLSTVIVACFSIGLLVRVLVKRRHQYRIVHWRKYRKMILQLLPVSIMHLIFNLPSMILWVARLCGVPGTVIADAQLINYFLSYWVMLLLPIVSITTLGDAYHAICDVFRRRKNNQITAITARTLVSVSNFLPNYELD